MRKKKLLLNSATSLLSQGLTVICGFVMTRLILGFYGSDTNGLVSSISQFLSFITFLEMGIGAVVKSALYQPLAQENNLEISKIVVSTRRFYRKIAGVLTLYTIVLSVLFPQLIHSDNSRLYTGALVVIIAISLFAQYFFGTPYQLLLNADQKTYIPTLVNAGTLFVNTLLSAILMFMGGSIHIVKLCTSLVYILRPLALNIYVHRKYSLNEKVRLVDEPLKQKWDGIAQHLAYVVLNNTDVAVLTLFSTLANVSIYTVYHNVTIGIQQIISCISIGISALLGNVLYSESQEKLKETFSFLEWFFHVLSVLLFSITGILIVPFAAIYTKGIEDANYIVPTFAFFITLAQAVYAIRTPYETMVLAANKFKETKKSAIIEAILNIVVSIAMVWKFGLVGVAIGTLIAMTYRTLYFVWYLRNHVLNYSVNQFVKLILCDVAQPVMSVLVCAKWFSLQLQNITWGIWVVQAIRVSAICLGISILINLIFQRKQIISLLGYLGIKGKKLK